ncbi:hypothetical protein E2C01_038718 [Portunus trituberculatus]|uniref:Uncharacterized protein n=1 Tax=Portunus trituberculatus TaxID=210409 RepID=A0A5B7FHI5_PORTR|nr:hypothetical protein [Portunus trituberculatus]
MLSEINLRMDKIAEEIKRETRNKYGSNANGRLTAVGEAKQYTVEHSKRLRHDLTEEFREELVAERQQCEGRTKVVKNKVEEVREEVTRL